MELSKIPILIASAVLLAGAALVARQVKAADPSPDEQTIAQLKKAGSDLSKPHAMEFYLYFPSKQAATDAEAKVKKMGLTIVRLDKAATGNDWLLLASTRMVPSKDSIAKMTAELTAVAKAGNGEYDGWEAGVTK